MSPEWIGFLGILAMLGLLTLRMPIGIAMLLVGSVGFAILNGPQQALMALGTYPYSYAAYYDLAVIPLFVLMGNLAAASGMGRALFSAAYAWVGHWRGGLASATIVSCAGFAAVSGSSVASAVTMGKVCLPEMKRYKYDDGLATGTVAAGGTLGILIPPSTAFIVYGILTEQSIGRLLLAGFFPGLLLTALFVITIAILTHYRPHLGPPGPRATMAERMATLGRAGPMMFVVTFTIGGIYIGAFTPGEAAAIGAFLALLYSWWNGTLGVKMLEGVLLDTVKTTAMVFLILIGALVFGPFLALSQLPMRVADILLGARPQRLRDPRDHHADLRRAGHVPGGVLHARAHAADRHSDRAGAGLRPDLVRRADGDRAGAGADQSARGHQRLRREGAGSGRAAQHGVPRHLAVRGGDGGLHHSADDLPADRAVPAELDDQIGRAARGGAFFPRIPRRPCYRAAPGGEPFGAQRRRGFSALGAGVAELVDAVDLGSTAERHGGSSPSARTKLRSSPHPRRSASARARPAMAAGFEEGRARCRSLKPSPKASSAPTRWFCRCRISPSASRANSTTMKDKVQINGFRPGKVPRDHLRKMYGKQVMGDVLQNAVNEANRKIVDDNGLRLANEPTIDIDGGDEGVKKAIEVAGDLAFTVNLEVLPKFDIGSFDDIELERPVVDVARRRGRPGASSAWPRRTVRSRPRKAPRRQGDKLTIDFVGKIDGVEFEGGKGEGIDLVLGSGQFIPGFEDQLVGASAGDERVVKVSFPEDYQAAHLAGKAAEFDVKVTAVAAPGELAVDDEFAKGFGMESLDKLKDAVRSTMQREYDGMSRAKLKRALLDELDKRYSFELPQTLVEQEFDTIWQQRPAGAAAVGQDLRRRGHDGRGGPRRIPPHRRAPRAPRPADGRSGRAGEGAGHRRRAVRGHRRAGAPVSRARKRPCGTSTRRTRRPWPRSARPLYEEKVVDLIVAKAKVTDKPVTKEDLLKEDEDEAADKA